MLMVNQWSTTAEGTVPPVVYLVRPERIQMGQHSTCVIITTGIYPHS